MFESVKSQTYPNIITIVHTDNPVDDYAQGDIIIRGERKNGPNMGNAPYNLYCNKLLESIPVDKHGEGWYHFMDDDDMYVSPDSIERFICRAKKTHVNIARSDRGNGNIWPRHWRGQKSFQTECFLLHTDHRLKATWHDKTAGDHYYSRQLTEDLRMPINWIEGLIVAKAQEGKGRGAKLDYGEGARDARGRMTAIVYFLDRVRSPADCRGEKGEIKEIPLKIAEKLFLKSVVKIIDKSEYQVFISDIMTRDIQGA
jgi:hypothetical protein